ncbi:MAG: acyl-CoA carboxylase subunit beta, partial [Calditrichaeota bacterium]|nr:acyl-CoA carboxylase subunit beta [Calditrichota bacterium]
MNNVIESRLDYKSATATENARQMKQLVDQCKQVETEIELGGGESNIEKQHQKNRLTARERINLLKDDDSSFFEIGKYAAYNMYEEYGGAASAGCVAGLAYVEKKLVMIIANDATVKAGAFFP